MRRPGKCQRLAILAVMVIWLACAIGVLSVTGAHAATLTVNTLADHDDGACNAADCTLREAMKYAAAGDTITFSVNGTIVLSLGQLLIDKNVTITGPGASMLAVDGASASRVFRIPAGVTASLAGLTIQNGHTSGAPGAGIYNLGTLHLSDATISGNSASGGHGVAASATRVARRICTTLPSAITQPETMAAASKTRGAR